MEPKAPMDPILALPHYMMRFAHQLMTGFKQMAGEKYHMNNTQIRTLIVLNRWGTHSMSELVHNLNIEKGSATSVVDCLISQDLVERERDPSDRRRVNIMLSPKGRNLALKLDEEYKTYIQGKIGALGEEKSRRMMELSGFLKDCLNQWEKQNNE